MPFKELAKFAKSKKDVLKDVPGKQTRELVCNVILSLIKNRRSIRKYTAEDVPDDIVYKIIEAGSYAPSEGNQQPWEFIVVRDLTTKQHLVSAAYNQNWMLQAPVFIVACINMRLARAMYGTRGEKLYGIQAVAAAIENILLAAESFGLGTCWVGAFSEPGVAIPLECPEYIRPCAIITLGWSAERPKSPPREDLEEFVHLEKFGESILKKKVVKKKSPFP